MTNAPDRFAEALKDRYTLERELGAGGMATVYLAEDLKHDRKVAIKVLRPELAAVLGAERFVQEIRTTANLQHPNILPLFDSGEAGGFLYYVMPYVEGETLRDTLNRETQLGVEEAVKIATEVADALAYAHQQGVIHRDIKPENILLHGGRPLVADFGIALAVSAAAGGRMTETGLSLGTPHYMSPEQATADKLVTHRSDIYSLGAVLYEMLTGDPPHTGSSGQAVILKIVSEEPLPVTRLRKAVPPHVAATVARALEKLPADRFATAAEFAAGLTGRGSATALRPAVATVPHPRLSWVLVALVLLIGVGLGLGLSRLGRRPAATAPSVPRVLDLILPDSLPLVFLGNAPLGVEQRALDLSRDGRQLAYISEGPSGTILVIHDFVLGQTRALRETDGAFSPSFSPDGRSVAFFSGTELKRVPTAGGTPQALASVDEPWGSVWVDSARIFVAGKQGGRPMFVDASTGRTDSIPGGPSRAGSVTPDRAGMIYGRDHLLYYYDFSTGTERILAGTGLVSADSAVPADAIYGFGATLLPSGHLLYVQQGGVGTLLAVRVERGTLRPVAAAVQLAANVRYNSQGTAQYAVAEDGFVVAATTPGSGRTALVARSPSGAMDSLGLAPADYGTFAISPDGRQIAALVWPVSGRPDLWVYDVTRGTSERVRQGDARRPVWIPGEGALAMLDTAIRGSGRTADVSRDGRFAAILEPAGNIVLQRLDSPGSGKVVLPEVNALLRFSPTGDWLAATVSQAGRSEVYVLPTNTPAARYRVSVDGGEEPRWTRDGRRIVFRYGLDWFESSFAPGDPPSIGRPRRLFRGQYENVPGYSFDVFPDGRYLLLLSPSERTADRLIAIAGLPRPSQDEEEAGRR